MHLLTDPLEAPKATAMLCCDQPCCLSSQARKRRHSFQACGDGVVVSMPLFYAEKSFLHCAAVCNLPCTPISKLKKCGQTDTGAVYEQNVQVTDPDSGAVLTLRRIEVRLLQNTRDGDRTIAVLTNLPQQVSAAQIADIYRQRWTIEKHFQFLTQSLNCEVSGL